MKYSKIIEQFNSYSLFDLYRIDIAISNELQNSERLQEIKSMLRPGMDITYFDSEGNRLIEAEILEIKRTNARVKNKENEAIWTIPFYMINIENIDTSVHLRSKESLDKNQLKVGDPVGYVSRDNEDVYGVITKLNPKRALVKLPDGMEWSVPYHLLFRVMETEIENQITIEAKLIE